MAVGANLAARARLTVLRQVGLALAARVIADLADRTSRIARAGATVDRLLAVVLDGAARAGTGLCQRFWLAWLRLVLVLSLAFAAMMGLAVLAPPVMAVPFALDAAAVLLVRLGVVVDVLPLCRVLLPLFGFLVAALCFNQLTVCLKRHHPPERQARQECEDLPAISPRGHPPRQVIKTVCVHRQPFQHRWRTGAVL